MKKVIFLLIAILFVSSSAYSKKRHIHNHESRTDSCLTAFIDSLNNLKASYYAYFRLWDDLDIPFNKKVKPNPDFYKFFVPPTYYGDVVKQEFNVDWNFRDYSYNYNRIDSSHIHHKKDSSFIYNNHDSLYTLYKKRSEDGLFKPKNLETSKMNDTWSNSILMKFYIQHPEMVLVNEMDYKDMKPLSDELIVTKPRKENVFNLLKPEEQVESVDSRGSLVVVKPNFWTHKGSAYAQFTQLYISDNWYKGGESTNALLSGLVLEANYNDRQKVQFENKLEMKLGFITAPSDTVHRYKTNADLIRITSKLGIQARHNWYYTLASELKSQFFANYQTNTNNLISNFLSPMQFDLTLGLDYKKSGKTFNLSLLTSPFAYNFVYIKDKDRIINSTTFNVPLGKRSVSLYGSKFSGNLDWKIIPNITWNSKLDYFTTYETVIANWENTFTLALNRYLSTKIFVHARYDDGVTLKGDNKSYFQFQELLSFGLNYAW